MIGKDGQAIRKRTMKRKKLSLFEETKILMVMKIYNISRSKAIEYVAAKMPDGGQKRMMVQKVIITSVPLRVMPMI
jgi:hypothetical protein